VLCANSSSLRRQQAELERLQARLDVLYEDRLDGRIDAGVYDQTAETIREQQQRVRQKIQSTQTAMLPAASQAIDLNGPHQQSR